MNSDQTVTATFAATLAGPQPGSYTGFTSQPIGGGAAVTLFVSPDSTQLQDVTIAAVALACTPSTPSPNPSPDQHFYIASIPINADGSFSATTTVTGVIGNAPVHFTYTFSGQFTGASVAGSVRENLSYDGTSTACTSNTQSWSAIRTAQGNQAALPPPAGSYTGFTSQPIGGGAAVTLFVSPDSTQLQDVTIAAVALACTPSTPSPNPSPDQHFYIASIPINADGSFSATTTVTGVIGNAPVHFTYTFSGHFHGRNSSDNARVAGSVRENLSYDGTSTACTSNTQSWSAIRTAQGNQAALPPPAGSYTGFTSQPIGGGAAVTLFVSPDSTQLQDVTIAAVALACTPSTPSPNPSPDQHFYIASIPINADGSFSATTTVTGVIGNAPVHFTYTFSGHFHGRNSSDNARVAGSVRENLSYDGDLDRLHLEHPVLVGDPDGPG